jgi:hypothetical protein
MIPVANNTNRHFKGQHKTEAVSCFCRKHWIILVKDFLGFIIFLTLLIITGIYLKGIYNFFSQDSFFINVMAIAIAGLFTFYLHKFFLRMVRYFLEIVIITNYRIVVLNKSLYLKDSKDATDLPKIQDIKKRQNGILRNFLRFGDLEITLSSSSTTKVLSFIPNPDYHFRKINNLKREYIKERLRMSRKPNSKIEKETTNHSFNEATFEGSHAV